MGFNRFESGGAEPPEENKHNGQESREHGESELVECKPYIEELEAVLVPVLEEETLEVLDVIETGEEALKSKERESAKEALGDILSKLKFLKKKTNITGEKFDSLFEKYKIISRAVGMINKGKVDHTREGGYRWF